MASPDGAPHQACLAGALIAWMVLSLAKGAAGGEGGEKDPFVELLAKERVIRPSSLLKFTESTLDPARANVQLPDLSGRLCECRADGGHNRTFWLNTASVLYQGQVYVVILNRLTMYMPAVTYTQTGQTRGHQVMEVNSLFFCKADLLSADVTVSDCQLVQPPAEYRERHPFPKRKHFHLVGLIDPRLVSAGDEHGLFLQVGCRPKELADQHTKTKFWEWPCLIKLLPGGGAPGPLRRALTVAGGARQARDTGGTLRPEQDPQAPEGQPAVWSRSALRGGGTKGALQAGAHTESGSSSGGGWGLGAAHKLASAGSTALPAALGEVFKEWPVGKLTVVTYASGKPLPYEKNWVPFEYQGQLLFNRHLSPQEVVTVHANGSATTLFRNKNKHVFKPLASVCGEGPRGNTPAVRITKEQTGLSRDFYLGTLHWMPLRGHVGEDTKERQCREHINFFYLMEAEPPFSIVEVARPPVPLVAATHPLYKSWPLRFGMGYISFPTGLVVLEDKVVVTYGVGDRSVRVWRAALKDVLLTFRSGITLRVRMPASNAPSPPPFIRGRVS